MLRRGKSLVKKFLEGEGKVLDSEGEKVVHYKLPAQKRRVRCLTGRGKERKQDACGDIQVSRIKREQAGTNERN